MIDLNAKYFCARTIPNGMSLAETLDKIRQLYKNISFESKIVRDGYDGLFNEQTKESRREILQYEFAHLYYYQVCIEYGNYKEVNPYVD